MCVCVCVCAYTHTYIYKHRVDPKHLVAPGQRAGRVVGRAELDESEARGLAVVVVRHLGKMAPVRMSRP